MKVNKIICGAAETELAKLPNEIANCSISSPPYWALRDYGVDGQLGLEKTFEEYIDKLCGIYDQVQRILRKDGTCFVNLGDTYSNKNAKSVDSKEMEWRKKNASRWKQGGCSVWKERGDRASITPKGIPDKSLCLIPERFAIEMVNRGWILRNKIIWAKPNPMPSSAKDRFTVDFEQVFFFVKSKKYFFEPQYEPHNTNWERENSGGGITGKTEWWKGAFGKKKREQNLIPNSLGRNKRCVWTMSRTEWLEWCDSMWVEAAENGAIWKIPTEAYSEAHFATFPRKLVEPMIKAGCPKYVCSECGTPRRKIYEAKNIGKIISANNKARDKRGTGVSDKSTMGDKFEHLFKGYTKCKCGKEFRPGIVLDPFCGIGNRRHGGRPVAA